jgi:hypothetical protein
MELSNYELVRYPSGQLIITKVTKGSAFRDVVGAFTDESEAQQALERLAMDGAATQQQVPSMTHAA